MTISGYMTFGVNSLVDDRCGASIQQHFHSLLGRNGHSATSQDFWVKNRPIISDITILQYRIIRRLLHE